MSRCFPFPPPGYEKKFKAENLDLLTKEKHREKKHKKEKREKEKREHKDKKEKDRNKDKHKDKKDRKEKHKDRKKGKDIDKGRTPEDRRAENRTEGQNELHIRESWTKAEEIKDSKFAEEFGRRTRDDGAANQLVGNITSSIPRKIEGVGTGSPLEKERGVDKKLFQIHNIGSAQRNYGSGSPFETVTNSLQRRAENTSTSTSLEKERSKMYEKLTVGISSEPDRNNGRPDIVPRLVNRKTEYSTAGMEKERSEKDANPNCIVSTLERGQLGAKYVASTSASTQRRNNAIGLSEDNFPFPGKNEVMANSSFHNRKEGMCSVPAVEKERIKGREMFPRPVSSEQRTKTSIGQPVEKDRYQKLDGKDTNENKKDDGRKGFKDSENSEKKSKPMDAVRHSNEKEKEEKIAKGEEIETDKTRNFGRKDKIDTLNSKPLAPHKDTTAGITRDLDMNKKKKDLKTNGFLHENDARPSKIPRLTSSSQPPVNDRALNLHLDAPFSLSLKDGAMNNMKPDRTLDNNERKINGIANSQQLAIEARPPSARGPLENGDVSLKLPHPDSKYLHQIYTVPKMEAWSEADDLDWLFECRDSQQKPKTTKHEAENVPAFQVWAEATRIDDSADAFALPYVVPF